VGEGQAVRPDAGGKFTARKSAMYSGGFFVSALGRHRPMGPAKASRLGYDPNEKVTTTMSHQHGELLIESTVKAHLELEAESKDGRRQDQCACHR